MNNTNQLPLNLESTLRKLLYLALVFPAVITFGNTGKPTEEEKSTAFLAARSFEELDVDFEFEESTFEYFEDGILPSSLNDSTQYHIGRATSLVEVVYQDQRFVDNLTVESLMVLPVGIKKTVGGVDFVLVIDRLDLLADQVKLSAYLQFILPQNGKTLTFYARGISFSSSGGIVGEGRLELVGTHDINIFGAHTKLQLVGTDLGQLDQAGSTYVTFDCNGFKELGLNGILSFSQSLFKPENEQGDVLNEPMTVEITTVLADWNDLILEIDLPRFQVNGVKGVGFQVQRAIFDFSDTRNAPGITFPSDYRSDITGGLWRGIYIYEFEVSLPRQLKEEGQQARKSFAASNVFIDNMGFSGTLLARNLITLEKGRLSKNWAFSLAELSFTFEANQLTAAGFSGEVVGPIMSDESPLAYTAMVNGDDEYVFSIGITDSLDFPIWGEARVLLKSGSSITIEKRESEFDVRAVLHGNLNIYAPLAGKGDGPRIGLANLRFEDLIIQDEAPNISFGLLALSSEKLTSAMATFPIAITEIRARSIGNEIGLGVDIELNIADEAIRASGSIDIIAREEVRNDRKVYVFQRVDIGKIAIGGDMGAVSVDGQIQFFRDDEIYGNGFAGQVNATIIGVEVKAQALFGKVDGYRYWYADALATIPDVPFIPPLVMNGIGGGAYSRMSQYPQERLASNGQGVTDSGLIYKPDRNTSFGVRATVKFKLPEESAFNGEATLDVSFHRKGGVRKIAFSGIGYLLTPPEDLNLDKLKEAANKVPGRKEQDFDLGNVKSDAAIVGSVSLVFDFENKVLHGNTKVFANIAGGAIRGVGPNGLVGEVVIHFAPGEWYILVGTPNRRVGLEFLGFARTESYLMIGTGLPGSPPPDQVIGRVIKGDLDYMRDENDLESGFGFALGSKFKISTGDLTFMIFYARLDVVAGFDLMIKDYGNASCANTGKALGINGWYANGQAYAALMGDVGVKVKMFGKTRKVNALTLSVAVLVQAKLPNPVWLRGAAGIQYNVLGGLIKGSADFKFELGKECELVNDESALEGVSIISQLTPGAGNSDVNVFTSPQAVFNYSLNKPFRVDGPDGTPNQYRVKLEKFEVRGDGLVKGVEEWNRDNTVVVLKPDEILPPNKSMTITATVSFEEYQRGRWVVVKDGGDSYQETITNTFITGDAPNHIPAENIAYMYPVENMMNLYPKEYGKGYIKLKQGQAYLFTGQGLTSRARFGDPYGGSAQYVNFQYDVGQRQLNFDIPGDLSPSRLYMLEVVTSSNNQSQAIDENISASTRNQLIGESDVAVEITTKEASGTLLADSENIAYRSFFRTSAYATFRAKMDGIAKSRTNLWLIDGGVHRMSKQLSGFELFDKIEVGDWYSAGNLISAESDLSDTKWFKDYINPLLYDGYPWQGDIRLTRGPEKGIPPIKSTFIDTYVRKPILDGGRDRVPEVPENATSGIIANFIAYEVYRDFVDLQSKAATYGRRDSERVRRLITTRFPRLYNEGYPTIVKYTLPGINKVTSSYPLKFGFNVGY